MSIRKKFDAWFAKQYPPVCYKSAFYAGYRFGYIAKRDDMKAQLADAKADGMEMAADVVENYSNCGWDCAAMSAADELEDVIRAAAKALREK